jgi:hypothetical protein
MQELRSLKPRQEKQKMSEEIVNPETESIEEQGSRKGWKTRISSVSISKEFKDILDKHNFSPTEVFRRGVAVMLHDIGDVNYLTELNHERSEFAEKFLKDIERFELIQRLKEIERKTKELKKLISFIDSYTENGGSQ